MMFLSLLSPAALQFLLLGVITDNVGLVVVNSFSILPQSIHHHPSQRSTTTTTTTTTTSSSFTHHYRSSALYSTTSRKPSRVSDPSGPSPIIEYPPPDIVDIQDIPEAHYDENAHPIPHQPWRRGLTNGCEAPIDAEWRREAERRIKLAVEVVGGTYIDTTWYLTSLTVTIGEDFQTNPVLKHLFRGDGPQINVIRRDHSFFPDDPEYDPWGEEGDPNEPVPLSADEDEQHVFFERDVEGEADRANRTYANADIMEGENDDDLPIRPLDKEVSRFVDKEYREDLALRVTDLKARRDEREDDDWHPLQGWDEKHQEYINTGGLSVIANAILEALEEVEDELQVLSRHELALAAPTLKRYLDTQKKFDNARGKRVLVRTDDPWKSNRVLYGILVDRNTLDVYINQKGNMVTIPNNFVAGVELMEDYEEEPDEEAEYEDEDEEVTAVSQSGDVDDEYEEEEYYDDDDDDDDDEEEYEEEEYEEEDYDDDDDDEEEEEDDDDDDDE